MSWAFFCSKIRFWRGKCKTMGHGAVDRFDDAANLPKVFYEKCSNGEIFKNSTRRTFGRILIHSETGETKSYRLATPPRKYIMTNAASLLVLPSKSNFGFTSTMSIAFVL